MIRNTLLSALGLLAVTLPVSAAPLLTNGSLDAWGTVAGTPPAGTPLGWWVNTSVTQTAGLTAGSAYSATLAGASPLVQVASTSVSNFSMNYNFAATTPSGVAGMRLDLYNGSGAITMSLAIFNSGPTLRMDAYNILSSSWVTIATGILPSVYDSATGVYTTANVYNFGLVADWANSTYSVTLGLVNGTQTTYSNLNYFYSTPTSAQLDRVYFRNVGGSSVGAFAVDNISLEAVPEPGTMALMGLGLAATLYAFRRTRA